MRKAVDDGDGGIRRDGGDDHSGNWLDDALNMLLRWQNGGEETGAW